MKSAQGNLTPEAWSHLPPFYQVVADAFAGAFSEIECVRKTLTFDKQVQSILLENLEGNLRQWIVKPPKSCGAHTLQNVEQYCRPGQRASLKRIVGSFFRAAERLSIRDAPGGYVFNDPPKSEDELLYKYETERVLEAIAIMGRPEVKRFARAIASACRAGDVTFFRRLGRVLAKKPKESPDLGVTPMLNLAQEKRRIVKSQVERLLVDYWIFPIGIVPGLCFVKPESLVEVCMDQLGLEEELSSDYLVALRQRLGLIAASRKIPITIEHGKMKIDTWTWRT